MIKNLRTRSALFFLLFTLPGAFTHSRAQAPKNYTSSELLLQLKKLNTVGSVLYIAAHPDDENTRLIAYLANEKCLRTGYLSLTRGDGGQNLIGPEQGVELGVIRTQELLAARRIDGGEQFFTRAYDFGYSKTPKETFQKWNHDSVLSDVVWVIRNFRPDIIITRFATDGSGGHGHHTASAILAEEAFDAAADPKRFPEQLQYVEVWQPRRLFYNATNRFRDPNADMSAFIKLDVGGYNPLLGKSYGEIAAESRSMHKSQGFGSARQRGEYFEYFKPLKGDTAGLKDIFQGMDFSWKRVKTGGEIMSLLDKTITGFKLEQTESSVPDLIQLLRLVRENTFINTAKKEFLTDQISEYILLCAKVFVEATSPTPTAVDSLNLRVISLNRGSLNVSRSENIPVLSDDFGMLVRYVVYGNSDKPLRKNIPDTLTLISPVSGTTQPYWLSKLPNGLFTVSDQRLIGLPENKGPFALCMLMVHGQALVVKRKIQYKWVEPDKGELYRPIVITPPVLIHVSDELKTFTNLDVKNITLTVTAGKEKTKGNVWLFTNEFGPIEDSISRERKNKEWPYDITPPFDQPFNLIQKGEKGELKYNIIPSVNADMSMLHFVAQVDSNMCLNDVKEIRYDHIPVQTLFFEAKVKLIRLDIKKKLKRIGYIPGAGDEVAPCLTQLGYEVITLTDEMLANENLNQYEAIVTGVRAYNTNEKLPQFKQKLMEYVNNGGNLIVQYNTNSWAGPLSSDIGPYKFKITRDRITDENAAVNFELPNHPVLNFPNKITSKDFEGWVQERCVYSAGEVDSNYVMPLSMADPDEKANKGSLIIGKYGKGYFMYTGLVFFRELPAGVPGAYRLFVNMIELGK